MVRSKSSGSSRAQITPCPVYFPATLVVLLFRLRFLSLDPVPMLVLLANGEAGNSEVVGAGKRREREEERSDLDEKGKEKGWAGENKYSHGPDDGESEVKVDGESEEEGKSDEEVSSSLGRVEDRIAGKREGKEGS